MDRAKWNRSFRRLTWRVKHQSGGTGGSRGLILVLAAALAVMMIRLLGGLPGTFGEEFADGVGSLGQKLGARLIMQNRPLFLYVRGGERARGAFRFMSEQLFGREFLFQELPEVNGSLQEKPGADGAATDKTGTKEHGETEEKEPNTGQSLSPGKGQGTDGGDDPVTVGDDLIDQVRAENESYSSYLPVGHVYGNIERQPSAAGSSGTQQAGGAGSVAGEAGSGGAIVGDISGAGAGAVSAKLLLENNYPLEKLSDSSYLLSNYYIVDSVTSAVPELFDGSRLLSEDLTIEKGSEGYQILIYHTHASEGFSDSRPGEILDTVRGPGEKLAEYLRAKGYTVYHDMTAYDRKDGKDNRNYAYSTARPQIEAFLAEHPEVEVIIDLHRDSGARRVTEIDGKKTAKIMLFNGLCRNASGPIADLENPNLIGNLSFSLQLNLVGRVLYPDLMYRIYLKNYRYNQHFRKRSLLIELGTEQNTVEEAYNAMEPLADILDAVLKK